VQIKDLKKAIWSRYEGWRPSGFTLYDPGFLVPLGFRVYCLLFTVQPCGLRVEGWGMRVEGVVCRVEGVGLRV
jgi:hypothetical protein